MEIKNEFFEKVTQVFGDFGAKLVEKAYDFAEQKHAGQKRDNGDDYFVHVFEVAKILLSHKADLETVVSGFLHDCLEDTDTKESEIKQKFGEEVLNICVGFSKIELIKQARREKPGEFENLRNMILALASDARVAFVKLADRMHNMQTLDIKPRETQVKIAKETMDLFVPIAEMLGMGHVKNVLADLSFKYILPEEYKDTKEYLDKKYKQSLEIVEDIGQKIKKEAAIYGIDAVLQSRVKSIYSFYKKTLEKGKDNIFDVIANRIIVKTVKDCYTMLGAVHNIWKPVAGRIKDYIAQPKQNFYRSLHTTVLYLTDNGYIPFEIQIRTEEMHIFSEYGMAAHWMYKEHGSVNTTGKAGNLELLTKKNEESKDSGTVAQYGNDFLDIIKTGFFGNSVFVFTPSYNVFELSKGSIVLDFAYAVHSKLGNTCVGAKVNSKMVPITTELKTGDVVEIQTSPQKTPSRDWLKIVNKSTASKIRAYFKKEQKEENIKIGKEMLEEFAKRSGFALSKLLEDKETLAEIQDKYHLSRVEDLFAMVGYGGITASQGLNKFISKINLKKKEQKATTSVQKSQKDRDSVVAGGQSDLFKKFAKCCNPIPGDQIVGYVSRGKGVTIHRSDCPHLSELEPDRFISTVWSEDSAGELYNASFKVVAQNANGVLNSISNKISENKIDISFLTMDRNSKNEQVVIHIGVMINSRKQLTDIIGKIGAMKEVYDVYR